MKAKASRKSSKYLVSHYTSRHHIITIASRRTTVLVVRVFVLPFFIFQSSSPSWTRQREKHQVYPVSSSHHITHQYICSAGFCPCSALPCPHVLYISAIVSSRRLAPHDQARVASISITPYHILSHRHISHDTLHPCRHCALCGLCPRRRARVVRVPIFFIFQSSQVDRICDT
jgi:hypothetical protein